MWTATLTGLEKTAGLWLVGVLYTDTVSGETFAKNYDLPVVTRAQLRDLVRREVTRLAATETTDIDIPIGTTIDVTPDVPTPPTPPTAAEVARAAWFTDYRQLRRLLEVTDRVPALATPQATTLIGNLRASLATD